MINRVDVSFGTDPELFVQRNGRIIGSEKVIPKGGLKGAGAEPLVIQDGVQVELNPYPSRNFYVLGRNIGVAVEVLTRQLKSQKASISWSRFEDIPDAELNSLTPESRRLGCNESFNVYGDKPMKADPETYSKRATGGHEHFGLPRELFPEIKNIVSILDIFVGLPSVLLDRDLNAAERRENYGRAGEYRLPDYGLEYRTLSSFWLRNYTLMHFVFGMAHLAISIVAGRVNRREDLEGELLDTVDIVGVIKAIDTNDFDLALKNFHTLVPFISKHVPAGQFPVSTANVEGFLRFVNCVHKYGLETYFPQDPVQHWVGLTKAGAKYIGFNEFLSTLR